MVTGDEAEAAAVIFPPITPARVHSRCLGSPAHRPEVSAPAA